MSARTERDPYPNRIAVVCSKHGRVLTLPADHPRLSERVAEDMSDHAQCQ